MLKRRTKEDLMCFLSSKVASMTEGMRYDTYEHYHKKEKLESLKSRPFLKNEYHIVKSGMVV